MEAGDQFEIKLKDLTMQVGYHIGEFADIDHLIPAETDHRFRGKLTT